MKSFKFVAIILLFTFSTHAFAICEHERNEFSDWNSKCEQLSAASQVSGAAGGIFAVATFGASLIPCAVAIATAHNACQIMDEKQQNLVTCEAHHVNLAKQAQEAAQAVLLGEQARQDRIAEINADFSNRRTQIVQYFNKIMQDFVNNLTSEYRNIEDPETQELIRTTRSTMERERDQRLDQLEIERKQAIANA